MSTENNVTFEDSKFKIKSRTILGKPEVPGLIKFLVNKKIVKNEKQAMLVMLISFILIIIISVILITQKTITPPAKIDPSLISNAK